MRTIARILIFTVTLGSRVHIFAAILFLSLLATTATAQQTESAYDQLWSRARLYSGTESTPVQSVVLSGRLQFDQANLDSGSEDHAEFNLRRFRFGLKVGFLENFTFHSEGEFDPQDGNPAYRRLTDTYVAWSPNEALELTVGKQGVAFTMDGQTSSKELLAIDRSNLTNNIWFTEEYIPGISVGGEKNTLIYNVGYFSAGEKDRDFGKFDGNRFVLATIGHDFADAFGVDEAVLSFNFVDNEAGSKNSFTKPLERVTSVNFSFESGRWGLRSDLSAAQGYLGQSDLQGFMLMPYLNLNDKLQLVGRVTYIDSDGNNGVRFARYESEIEGGRGDEYSEAYAGMNYYLYGHKLKLQTGLQYADMNDRAADGGAYTGWSWITGLRISW